MELNDKQTKKLLDFTGQPELQQLALKLALTRLKGMYKADPAPATVSKCTVELNAILGKFAQIMKADYEWMIKL
jgi:hypothetical protein